MSADLSLDDDAQLLQVVEAYCSLTSRSRQAVKSSKSFNFTLNDEDHFNISLYIWAALLESPQVLIAEEEKIIVEEVRGTQTVVEEK